MQLYFEKVVDVIISFVKRAKEIIMVKRITLKANLFSDIDETKSVCCVQFNSCV